jgi:RimJ/RimL family protein N-acetyltransferase
MAAYQPKLAPLATRLSGSLVDLEPLEERHREELWEAAQDPRIWEWLAHLGENCDLFDGWFDISLEATAENREGVFAIRRRADDLVVGSSRFMAVRRPDRVVEIGWTWFNPSAWRTGVNLETKLLMLGYAFDELGCVRVELKTDARNERSRNAIAALPAQFEGIFRKHMIVPDVGQRDSAYYSVIDEEWPQVRGHLQRRLGR